MPAKPDSGLRQGKKGSLDIELKVFLVNREELYNLFISAQRINNSFASFEVPTVIAIT